MFSGLINSIGRVHQQGRTRLAITAPGLRPKLGDSIAINGVCLTVSSRKGAILSFDLSEETVEKTTLSRLRQGTPVNLEPALKMADSLGGHIVQGHVDGTGRVRRIILQGEMKTIWFEAPKSIMEYIVSKGSVTVDGVSLTAVEVKQREFSVALIPFTLQHTNLDILKKGDLVNLEADIIGKYVAKYLRKK